MPVTLRNHNPSRSRSAGKAVTNADHAEVHGIGIAVVTFHDVATGKCLESNLSANNPDPDMGAAYTKSCNHGNFQNWDLNILYYTSDGLGEVMTIFDDQPGSAWRATCLPTTLATRIWALSTQRPATAASSNSGTHP
jgi:hypothetical protein